MAGPRVTVVADPRFLEYDFGPSHPWDPRSRWLAARLLEQWDRADRLASRIGWVREVPLATDEELLRFHSAAHLARVRAADRRGHGELLDRGDTPSFPGCFDAAARVVGGTLRALDAITSGRTRRAFQPAGGLHHAARGAASGFCIFNDLGVAIATALAGPFGRIAYVDIDLHHGDGVMYGFYEDGRVLDVDFHETGRTLFPGTGDIGESGRGDGAGLKVNVPLPPGAGDEAFLPLFRRLVPPMLRTFRPELIVLQHGVDAHVGDPLGHLRLTGRSYGEAMATVRGLADELCDGRMLVTGGGGYSPGPVALLLALAGAGLAGAPEVPSVTGPLPEAWRTEFEQSLGRPSPRSTEPVPAEAGSRWSSEDEERTVAQLELVLGTRFPKLG